MKYLCLVYLEEQADESRHGDGNDVDAVADVILTFSEELRTSGNFVAAAPLQTARTATTIHLRNGRFAIADEDGPEAGAWLSAYLVIEARDLNDAIRIAAKLPAARAATIDVRPLYEGSAGDGAHAGRALLERHRSCPRSC